MLVSSNNEWSPLEEVIVGSSTGARIPARDISLQAIELHNDNTLEEFGGKVYPREIVDETNKELEDLCDCLKSLGVIVRRPDETDHTKRFSSPLWEADGMYNYCPRDVILIIGDLIIETPMALRSRYFEALAYKSLLLEYFRSGARWISAPKPSLPDSLYNVQGKSGSRLRNLEPVFDAANVIRLGKDILYLVSDSGNEMGADWLESIMGNSYTIHRCKGLYASTHIDSTIVALRPGLVLLNPERVNHENLPKIFEKWDKIYAPVMNNKWPAGRVVRASPWIGMNLLSVRPDLAIVDANQADLMKLLERQGISTIPMKLTHARSLGGGFHCVTLDVRRKSET